MSTKQEDMRKKLPSADETKGKGRAMAFIDDLGILDEKRDPKGFVDDLGLADENPPAKKKTGAFDEYGKADASESKTPPPPPARQSAFAEFGNPEPEPRSLVERAGRFLTHDLPERLNIRRPSGPSVPAAPPEESMLAAAEGSAPAPEPVSAGSMSTSLPPRGGSIPATVPPSPAPATPAGPLSKARDAILSAPRAPEVGETAFSPGMGLDFPRSEGIDPYSSIRPSAELTPEVRARATDILTLSEMTGLPTPFIEANFDAVTKELGIRGTPTTGELATALMQIGIAQGLATAPLRTVGAVAGFMGAKEGESLLTQAAQGERPKLGAGRELKELAGPLREPLASAADVAEFVIPGMAAGAGARIPKAIADSTWFRKLTIKERGLVVQSIEDLRKAGASEGELARKDPAYWKKAFKERGGVVEEEAPAGPPTPATPATARVAEPAPTFEPTPASLPEQTAAAEAPVRLFTKDQDGEGVLIEPDFKAIADEFYARVPSAHEQPRSLVEWSARETWKRSRWDPSISDQTLFERMNARIAAKMKESPASVPASPAMLAAAETPVVPQAEVSLPSAREGEPQEVPKAPDAAVEPTATEKAEGILDSEEGFLDVSSLAPGVNAAQDVKAGITSLLLPTAKSPEHLRAAEVLGSKLGSMHRDAEVAAQSVEKDSRMFDKLGVHDPEVPLRDNPGVRFMSHRERIHLSPEIQKVGDKVQNLFDDRVRKLENAGAAMRTIRENYFPGMWTQESIKAFNQAAAEVVTGMEAEGRKAPETYEDWSTEDRAAVKARGQEILKGGGKGSDKSALSYLTRRQLKGKESFRKQKVFDDIMDGIDFGLVPISRNPIDLVKLKLAEMDRSIMANRALREWEKAGDVKFLRTGQQMPEGFAKINDKYGTVYGPPVQTVSEHVDKAVYDGLTKVAKGLGIDPERRFSAGRGKLGYASPSGETVTQFATELSVLAHEIGHQIDFKYGLWDKIVAGAVDVGKRGEVTKTASAAKRGKIQDELRALADLTWEGSEASDYYKKKVRKRAEKMAHMLEAYIHAPDRFKEVAPTVYSDFDAFVKSHDELKGLSEIKQGLALEKISIKKPVGGFPVIGSRIAKKPVADILNNFLSSSIYNSPYFGTAFKGYMGTANALNQTQLGMGSAFHAGFTSADVQISHNAEVIKDIYGVIRGNRTLGDLGRTIKKVPAAMITNPRRGAKVVAEWRTPTLEVSVNVPVGQLPRDNPARVAMIAKAMELAGGASRIERGLKTEWTEKQIREWYGNQKVKAAARTPIVLVELLAKPIMEYLVPRQKAGVFGELAGRIIEQNPGKTMEQLIPQFRQAWNRVDARLGQVVYDRLFINNMAKNVIQGAIRAPGWTGGTIGEVITGAPKDFVNFFTDWKRTGKAPQDIPDRVAYVIALLGTVLTTNYLLTKAFTGEDPEGMDWWAFRTGGVDERGRPERFILPTYAKDLFSWWEDWGHTLVSKTHPLLGVIGDIYRNHDYYGVKIRNEDDPPIKQLADSATYGLKQFEPFWIRGAKKETQRGGGFGKTITEEPQKILAPQLGIMPATSAYTMTPFEKFARKTLEERRPRGTRTKEEAERTDLKRDLEQKLRRGDPGAMDELYDAMRSGEITRREAQTINQRSGEDYTTLTAKSMTLKDLAAGISLASDKEKALIKPIFKKKIQNKTGQIDGETRDRYIDIFRGM